LPIISVVIESESELFIHQLTQYNILYISRKLNTSSKSA